LYQLITDPTAEEQIAALPSEALRPLAELFTLLETAPWSGLPGPAGLRPQSGEGRVVRLVDLTGSVDG